MNYGSFLDQLAGELWSRCQRVASGSALIGLGSSNAPQLVTDGQWHVFLNVRLDDVYPPGCDGMATVHVFAREILPAVIPDDANSRLVVHANWGSGLGGGEAFFDGEHGAILTLGANSALNLRARLEPAVDGAPLVVGSTYKMEAVTKWYTSARSRGPSLSLAATPIVGGTSGWFKIPRQARTVSGLVVDPAAYPTLFAQLATAPAAAAIRYSTLVAPRDEPVVAGVEWVRWLAEVDTLVTPEFGLWI